MSYAQGGLIEASDYNGFVGTSPSSTANRINTIWAVGNGNRGYGQTALSQVTGGGLVTATQWATAVNTLNSIKTHQTGTGTGIGAPTAGSLITYLSTFSSSLNTVYTNALNANSQGTTTTGTVFSPNLTSVNTPNAVPFTITRTATFANADAARYFFNAGGQLNFVVSSVTNGDATARSGDLVTLAATNFGGYSAFKSASGGGRTGTGGTATTNSTSIGYYNLTTSDQTLVGITSTTANYTGDTMSFAVKSNGLQGSNADTGTVITFTLTLTSAATPAPAFNETINITVNHRVDVVYPETTNLTQSWGSVTIA